MSSRSSPFPDFDPSGRSVTQTTVDEDVLGRHNPQSRLEAQPVVILDLITQYLGISGSAVLASVNRRYQARSNGESRIAEQKLQWDLMLLPEEWTENFAQNETLIRQLAGRTVNLSNQERRLWRAARRSINERPAALTEEQRSEYIERLLPKLHQALTVPPSQSTVADWALLHSLFGLFTYGGVGSNLTLSQFRIHISSYSLSALVYALGDISAFLEVFAIDGGRFPKRRVITNPDYTVELLSDYEEEKGGELLAAIASFLHKGRKAWYKKKPFAEYVRGPFEPLPLGASDDSDTEGYYDQDKELSQDQKRARHKAWLLARQVAELENQNAIRLEEYTRYNTDPNFSSYCFEDFECEEIPNWRPDEKAQHLMLLTLAISAFKNEGSLSSTPFPSRYLSFQPGAYRMLPASWIYECFPEIVQSGFYTEGRDDHYLRTVQIGAPNVSQAELLQIFREHFRNYRVRFDLHTDGSLSYSPFMLKSTTAALGKFLDRILELAKTVIREHPVILWTSGLFVHVRSIGRVFSSRTDLGPFEYVQEVAASVYDWIEVMGQKPGRLLVENDWFRIGMGDYIVFAEGNRKIRCLVQSCETHPITAMTLTNEGRQRCLAAGTSLNPFEMNYVSESMRGVSVVGLGLAVVKNNLSS